MRQRDYKNENEDENNGMGGEGDKVKTIYNLYII